MARSTIIIRSGVRYLSVFKLLEKTVLRNSSDLHITAHCPPIIRVKGELIRLDEASLTPGDTKKLIQQLISPEQEDIFIQTGELDFSYSIKDLGRFRINIYKQKGSYALAARVIPLGIPSIEELGLPAIITKLAQKQRGLILVTGPTGSGKSTTLAAMIDYINKNENKHILTLEDPVEYVHTHNNSIVNQREIGTDSSSFSNGLRSALRQDPNVILVGEMRDLETIATALTAAETGHLVLSTLHTIGAAKTIDRIIDAFPPHQQQQIKVQLASVLEAVISQQLIPEIDKQKQVAACEVMISSSAIRNLIREGKTHQIQTSIQTSSKMGMKTMDTDLFKLYKSRKISRKNLEQYAVDIDMINRLEGNKTY